MKVLITIITIQCSLSLMGQNPQIENHKRMFQDTIIAKNMKNQFHFTLAGNLEINFYSRITSDSSFVTIELTNEDSQYNLWIGTFGGSGSFNEKRWNAFILPDFSYHSPIHFLMLKPGEKYCYSLNQKGVTKKFNFTTYIMDDYKLFMDAHVPKNQKISFTNCEGQTCFEVPFKTYPSKGLTWVTLEEFPVELESNNATFTISN